MTELYGMDTDPLPDGWTPLEGVAIVKCLDEEGRLALALRCTPGLNVWEAYGMLSAASDTERAILSRSFTTEDGDDDEAGR